MANSSDSTPAAGLGDFLRACRAHLAPEQAGLPADGRARRVPGLRRDEVARLAGVSVEYYTRLEQGRAANPSPEVVAALVRALRMDASENEYFRDLLASRPRRSASASASGTAADAPQRVRPGLHLMLRTLDHVPAFVIGHRTDVLAANRLALALVPGLAALPAPRRNLARYYLLDPAARELVLDWERIAAETVAMLRLEAGRHPNDRRLAELIGELALGQPKFAAWWDDHRVLRRTYGDKRYRHPAVGELHFAYESFQAPGDDDQTLCVYNVEPGTPTEDGVRLLASWAATEAAEAAEAARASTAAKAAKAAGARDAGSRDRRR